MVYLYRHRRLTICIYRNKLKLLSNVVIHKSLSSTRHSGLDPESSVFGWIPAFAGMTAAELT